MNQGKPGEDGDGISPDLALGLGPVILHGLIADTQFTSDLLDRQSLSQALDYLSLSMVQIYHH